MRTLYERAMSAAQDVEEALAVIAAQVTGLRGVYVSDRDGIPILSHSSVQPSLRYFFPLCQHIYICVPASVYICRHVICVCMCVCINFCMECTIAYISSCVTRTRTCHMCSTSKKASGQAAPLDGAFALSADQISRLQLGQCQTMCATYEEGIVMHVNTYPLVLTLVGDADADAEQIMAIAPRIQVLKTTLYAVERDLYLTKSVRYASAFACVNYSDLLCLSGGQNVVWPHVRVLVDVYMQGVDT